MPKNTQELRKLDHLELAMKAQSKRTDLDFRFYYEPLFNPHPDKDTDISIHFLGKKLLAPFWISSMTGGVECSKHINQNLARVAKEFGLGMGLGSCRTLLASDTYFDDFNLRPILGDDLPFFANLGIAQVEQLLEKNEVSKISQLIDKLEADGLMVHLNILQEWFQPEGDRLKHSPLKTLEKLCHQTDFKIMVKEVGHGLGPLSLGALLNLRIEGIEFGAFGGTNFSLLEEMRAKEKNKKEANDSFSPLVKIGHTASQMVHFLNTLLLENKNFLNKQIIISGGIDSALDGFYLKQNLNYRAVIGQAKNYLQYADNYLSLKEFVGKQINEYKMAQSFLKANPLEFL